MRYIKAVLLFVLLFSVSIFADETRPSYLQIKALDNKNYDVIWKVPAKNLKEQLAINVTFDKDVESSKESVGTYVDGFYVKNWRIKTHNGLSGTTLEIIGLDSTSTEVLLRIIDEEGVTISGRITPSLPEYTFDTRPSTWETIKTYTMLGIEHILEGTDHLLFVACLVFIAGTFTKLLWTITGFTLAHSVTLFISAMDWIRVPIPPIEAAIALSIVFLAVEIVKGDKNSFTYRYPGVVSSAFGLLHGFGFASALMEIGLPQKERITALLFFNVGVELGQLIFVAAVLSIGWIVKKVFIQDLLSKGETAIAYVIGSLAAFWLIERTYSFCV